MLSAFVSKRGIGSDTASKIIAHADIKMIMRYAHPTPENKRRAVEKLGELPKTRNDQGRVHEIPRCIQDNV